MRTLFLLSAFSLASASSAFGQSNNTPQPAPAAIDTRVWRVGGGYQTLEFRDVSRTRRPVDASPVTWSGRGPAVEVQHDRASLKRLHHFQFNAAWSGAFEYATPVRTFSRPEAEKAALVDGRYEYRRYPLRDLGMQGLDLGFGAEGAVAFSSMTRSFQPEIDTRYRGTDFSGAGALAGRLRRWRSWTADVAWTNGIAVGHSTFTNSVAAELESARWGGGWLTDFTARGDVRVSTHVTLFGEYFTSGRGRYQSHFTFVSARAHVLAGVVYVR